MITAGRMASLRQDARRLSDRGNLASVLRLLLTTPAFRAVALVRLAASVPPPVGRLIAGLNLSLHGADIDPRAQIGAGLLLQHPVGVVIGGGATLGERCTLMSGVVLGRRYIDGAAADDGYPTLGDDVIVGTTAVVLGRVIIGDGSRVGALSLVLHDIPDRMIATGSPAVARYAR